MHGALRGVGPAPAGKLWRGSAFALRARGEEDRFQSGLRTHPAPLEYFWLRDGSCARREARVRFSIRAAREG